MQFQIRVDHDMLRWTLNFVGARGVLALQLRPLDEFEFQVLLRACMENYAADVLLRLRIAGSDRTEPNDALLAIKIWL